MKKFSRNNLTLVFFQRDGDKKYSFYIENEYELTEQLLSTVTNKRVKKSNIKYAVEGIFDLLNKEHTGYWYSRLINDDKQFSSHLKENWGLKVLTNSEYEAIIGSWYNNPSLTIKKENIGKNPIVVLSELIQRQYGKNIETRIIGKTGADHEPVISVEIELPDGKIFEASGNNKRIAKQKAAEKALQIF
jgi:hypothetical protein